MEGPQEEGKTSLPNGLVELDVNEDLFYLYQ